MQEILQGISQAVPSELLLGFETNDDAAVYRIADDLAAVLTVDFFTPIVDDPYDFGRVTAANALSDVFAMGARPHIALNLLALDPNLGKEIAHDIIRGGTEKVNEAGAFIAGGHSIDDDEPKYGLAVFGTVHPDRIIRNAGAQSGDFLYLTKPIGTGIMSAAYQIGEDDDEGFRPVIESMAELNKFAAEAMIEARAHAATDITGFGLAGHLHEMLEASGCDAVLDWEAIPLFEGVWKHSCDYCRPNKTFSIMDYLESHIEQGDLSSEEFDNRMGVVCDPQTSGGMLVSIAPEHARCFEERYHALAGKKASRIGAVVDGEVGRTGKIRFSV